MPRVPGVQRFGRVLRGVDAVNEWCRRPTSELARFDAPICRSRPAPSR